MGGGNNHTGHFTHFFIPYLIPSPLDLGHRSKARWEGEVKEEKGDGTFAFSGANANGSFG